MVKFSLFKKQMNTTYNIFPVQSQIQNEVMIF